MNPPLIGKELSARSYRQVLETLPPAREQVLRALMRLGRATAAEVHSALHDGSGSVVFSNVRSRLGELVGIGFARVVGTTIDPRTRKEVSVYSVIPRGVFVPIKTGRKSRRELLE